jgi:hypothetical protein
MAAISIHFTSPSLPRIIGMKIAAPRPITRPRLASREVKRESADQPTAATAEQNGQRYRVLSPVRVILLDGTACHGTGERTERDPPPHAALSAIVDGGGSGTR